MSRRLIGAGIVLLAWFAGLGMLVRREYFRPHIDRLAEAALRVQPAAMFYAVMQGDRQVGFASSTLDTATNTIEQRDYLVADLPVGGKLHRTTARTTVILTRTLRLRSFELELDADDTPMRMAGEVEGDSVLLLRVRTAASEDTQRVALSGPLLLPTLAPLAVALEERPSVGRNYVLPLFDPTAMAPRDVRIDVRAESLFVVNDSSVFDSTSMRWKPALPDTVRAWQLVAQSGAGVGGWVDQQGRLVSSSQLGFRLVRLPYEVAFENWRLDSDRAVKSGTPAATVASNRDVLEITAIAANKRITRDVDTLRLALGGVPLDGFNLHGYRQSWDGDTLVIVREGAAQLSARYLAPALRNQFPEYLKPEPFLEVDHPEIAALAQRLAAGSREPRGIVQRINRWVHDSVRKEITIGIPSALHVLHTRRGDCNEHTQLFVALARAAGVPARVAAGLVYLDGKFYYHAWPEVLLRGWVAVDPTFDQMPADAGHIRFVVGSLGRQAELLRLTGGLTIDVIDSR